MKESFYTHVSPYSGIYPEQNARSPQPIQVLYTLTAPLGKPPER